MPVRKIAISVPEPVLAAIDALARRRGESRSRVISTVLARVGKAKRDRDVTAAVDALFCDETVAAEQLRTAERFRKAGAWRRKAR